MGVDVVGAVLGVVFDDEEGGLGPEFRVADGLDELAEGEVVIGHQGGGGELAGGGRRGCGRLAGAGFGGGAYRLGPRSG